MTRSTQDQIHARPDPRKTSSKPRQRSPLSSDRMKINVALGLLLFCAPLMTGGTNVTECYKCEDEQDCDKCLSDLDSCEKASDCNAKCFTARDGEGMVTKRGCKVVGEDCGTGETCCNENLCNKDGKGIKCYECDNTLAANTSSLGTATTSSLGTATTKKKCTDCLASGDCPESRATCTTQCFTVRNGKGKVTKKGCKGVGEECGKDGVTCCDANSCNKAVSIECYKCDDEQDCDKCLSDLGSCEKSTSCTTKCFIARDGDDKATKRGCKVKEDCNAGGITCCTTMLCNDALAVGGMPLLVPLLVPLLAAACLALFR
ncbi:uncharacterized protein LOC144035663 [Vanacampus margaritifer]